MNTHFTPTATGNWQAFDALEQRARQAPSRRGFLGALAFLPFIAAGLGSRTQDTPFRMRCQSGNPATYFEKETRGESEGSAGLADLVFWWTDTKFRFCGDRSSRSIEGAEAAMPEKYEQLVSKTLWQLQHPIQLGLTGDFSFKVVLDPERRAESAQKLLAYLKYKRAGFSLVEQLLEAVHDYDQQLAYGAALAGDEATGTNAPARCEIEVTRNASKPFGGLVGKTAPSGFDRAGPLVIAPASTERLCADVL
jgi:hypothetical protein